MSTAQPLSTNGGWGFARAVDGQRLESQIGPMKFAVQPVWRALMTAGALPLLLVILLAAALLLLDYIRPAAEPATMITETKDRLPSDAMAALVMPAMEAVCNGDLGQAEFLIERQIEAARIAHGEHSIREADILSSFGVELYAEGQSSENNIIQQASLRYLSRAIPATRAAFGARDPEVALALHSLADAEIELADQAPSAIADAALNEAYDIRVATLGRHNLESVATLAALGRLEGLPARVKGDPVRLRHAVARFERAIVDTPRGPAAGTQSEPALRAQLARIYLANGKRRLGLTQLIRAEAGLTELGKAQALDVMVQLNNVRSDFDLPEPTPPRR